MAKIKNPILPGFHPDPSILRVGEDYYIATSTFEWFPGVQIHHSRDLVKWDLVGYPLDRVSQLDMLGADDSAGVWAPCLSYDKGIYYLIYTNVKSFHGLFKDTPNYLVTASDIRGPWSGPVYLNASGFDPSLFHSPDGKKYLVNMVWDHRSYENSFGGIVLQEYSEEEKKLVGPVKNIFKGTSTGLTEGPHLYWHDGYYYLMTAEGGTSYEHAITVARSRNLEGPYEPDPAGPLLTTRHLRTYGLQKSGHGSLIEGANGRWYVAHLCGRPLGEKRRCVLGRETALQEVCWQDGWLRMSDGTNRPSLEIEIPGVDSVRNSNELHEEFDQDQWSTHLQSLRVPLNERASLTVRKGWLRLYGGESPTSKFHQSLLAHRQQAFCCTVTTKMEFEPENFQQMAGLIYYYSTYCFYYLHVTRDERQGKMLTLLSYDGGRGSYPIGAGIPIPEEKALYLRLSANHENARFSYSLDGTNYSELGPVLDATILSDDYCAEYGQEGFTGAFVGICCQDLAGKKRYADFDWLYYEEQ